MVFANLVVFHAAKMMFASYVCAICGVRHLRALVSCCACCFFLHFAVFALLACAIITSSSPSEHRQPPVATQLLYTQVVNVSPLTSSSLSSVQVQSVDDRALIGEYRLVAAACCRAAASAIILFVSFLRGSPPHFSSMVLFAVG